MDEPNGPSKTSLEKISQKKRQEKSLKSERRKSDKLNEKVFENRKEITNRKTSQKPVVAEPDKTNDKQAERFSNARKNMEIGTNSKTGKKTNRIFQ